MININEYHKIIRLRKRGKTIVEIAKIYNVTKQAISLRIIKGIPKLRQVDSTWKNKPQWLRTGRDMVREMARNRDKHTCQDCGKKWREGIRRFDVHHLNGLCGKRSRKYDKVASIKALVTLCHKCHFNRPEHTVRFTKSAKYRQKSYPLPRC